MNARFLWGTSALIVVACGGEAVTNPGSGTGGTAGTAGTGGAPATGGTGGIGVDASPDVAPPTGGTGGTTLTDGSVPDAAPDGEPTDAPVFDIVDGSAPFPDVMFGTWLIGWSGGMNHYSWVRIDPDPSMFQGPAIFLDGADLPVNAPFFPCNGEGEWTFGAAFNTLHFRFPDGCAELGISIIFDQFEPYTGGYVTGAILTAQAQDQAILSYYEAYKFPNSQCNPSMTSCADPFGP